MSRLIAAELSKAIKGVNADALAGTAGKYLDADLVHAAFNQYGLGSPNVIGSDTDLNNYLTPGIYSVNTSINVLNRPTGSGLGNFIVVNYADSPTKRASQLYLDIYGKAWIRGSTATDTWTDWRELYHTGNILGTVSQSSGVPTGAIIERGSNANGEYVKFADGTVDWWVLDKTISYSTSQRLLTRITLPVTLINSSHVTVGSRTSSNTDTAETLGSSVDTFPWSTTEVDVAVYANGGGSPFVSGDSARVYLHGKGRWY